MNHPFNLKTTPYLFLTLMIFACGQKSAPAEEPDNAFFSMKGFIESEVAEVENGVYPIQEDLQTNHSETTDRFVKREEFRELAAPFLSLPEISQEPLKAKYQEDKFMDNTLNRIVFVYSAVDSSLPVRREEVHIQPEMNADSSNTVQLLMADTWTEAGDSVVQQHLSWRAGRSFQVVRSVFRNGTEVSRMIRRIHWNEPSGS